MSKARLQVQPCPYGVTTCMCCWCEEPCNNGLQCWECNREGKAVHNTYLCTGFTGTPPWERERTKKEDSHGDAVHK